MLSIPRYFTTENVHPFDAVAWEVGDVVIQGKDGPVFEAKDIEFPASWSQRARDIVASKYFRVVPSLGNFDFAPERETSVKQMIHRVVHKIALWGYGDKYFHTWNVSGGDTDIFADELTHILLNQYASFNSPVWFNVGVQECPQTSACYILDVEDSMESILEWYRQEGMIFKNGSGSGVNLSKIRPKGAPLSGGGTSSGVMSFAKVADASAGAIKSGGTTRRAAKLLVLDVEHPDIEEFIQCKVDSERLARHLMHAGYGNGIEGGAYDNVPWQNANNSVSVPDVFMAYALSPNPLEEVTSAQEMLHKIATATWECGDPSITFRDTINRWHTTPSRGPIRSGNPCQEFLRPPNEACNLASINLLKFLKDDGSFDISAFCHTVDIMITAMDILIDRSSYPTEAIAQNSREYRPLGLGYSNLGAFLMAQGLPYDSDSGRALASAITALLTGKAYSQSARVAEAKGSFKGFANNRSAMQAVVGKHIDATATFLCESIVSKQMAEAINAVWANVYSYTIVGGFRNCQVTVLAPCGTISFMMDCDTTGVEPCLGLVTTKKLVGGGEIKMVNGVVDRALLCMGYTPKEIDVQVRHIQETGLFFGNALKNNWAADSAVFDTALGDNAISWQSHIKMVAAVQPFLSGGCSKTINMPYESTVQDIFDAYVMAWKMGLKAVAIYRDGSKGVQPVTVPVVDKGKVLSDAADDLKDAPAWAKDYAAQYRFMKCEKCMIPSGTLALCLSCARNHQNIEHFKQLWINRLATLYAENSPAPKSVLSHLEDLDIPSTLTSKASVTPLDEDEAKKRHWATLRAQIAEEYGPKRRRLPDERAGKTHKFTINTQEGYLTVSIYEDGSPGELFVRMSKEGSTLGGLMDAWATMVSIALQYGVPLEAITSKFKDTQFDPRGFTGNPEIKIVSSVLDYISKWLEKTFLRAEVKHSTDSYFQSDTQWSLLAEAEASVQWDTRTELEKRFNRAIFGTRHEGRRKEAAAHVWLEEQVHSHDNGALPLCSECGGMTQRAGSCCVCTVCGTSTGCA